MSCTRIEEDEGRQHRGLDSFKENAVCREVYLRDARRTPGISNRRVRGAEACAHSGREWVRAMIFFSGCVVHTPPSQRPSWTS